MEKQPIWKQTIVVSILICTFSVIILVIALDLLYWDGIIGISSEGIWWGFLIIPFKVVITFFYYSLPGFLLAVLALIFGIYLGLRKRGRILSIYPIISLSIGAILFFFWCGFFYIPWAWAHGYGMGGALLEIMPFVICFYLIFLCPYLLVSSFFHFHKERLLFKITFAILFLLIIGGVIGGRILANLHTSKKGEFEEGLTFLLQQAVEEQNSEICEEIKQYYNEEVKKTPTLPEYGEVMYQEKYYHCITELATKLNDISLCERLKTIIEARHRKIILRPNAVQDCITQIALNNKDVKICGGDEVCIKKVSKAAGDPELCGLIRNKFIREDCLDQFK